MQNEPWVWPEVGLPGRAAREQVPLRSAQMMGQQEKDKRQKKTEHRVMHLTILQCLLLVCRAMYKRREIYTVTPRIVSVVEENGTAGRSDIPVETTEF